MREIDAADEELSLRPTDRGVLVHAVLDAVIAEHIVGDDVPGPDEPWSAGAHDDLGVALRSWCSEAERRGVVGHPLLWRLEQRRLRRRVDAFLALDRQARSELGVAPDATEMDFGYDAPFTIDLPDGRRLTLVGQVDRVDTGTGTEGATGVVAVIDYKTGRAPSPWEVDPFVGGVRLQLPIYGMAARERLGRPGAQIAAEYWYLHDQRKDRGRRRVDVGPRTLDRLPVVLAHIADAMAAGLFVPHPAEPNPWSRSRLPLLRPGRGGHGDAVVAVAVQAGRPGPGAVPGAGRGSTGGLGRATVNRNGDEAPLPDAAVRRRIATGLESTLFVSAGAGSGKTTQLVDRVVALVRAGVAIESIAAITFTEKAADELRHRIRLALQPDLIFHEGETAEDPGLRALSNVALDDLDQAAFCTLHAFANASSRPTRSKPAFPLGDRPRRDRCPTSTSTSGSRPSTPIC